MLTIVVASYKYGHLAAHCIESILSQSVPASKILFVDDGAGDCTHLPSLYPEVEYTLRESNMGTAANFQDMLMKVHTEYTMFIGADNWLRSDTVETLTQHRTDIVTYDIIITGEFKKNHPVPTTPTNGDLYWERKGHHGSMMYKTALAQKVGYKRHHNFLEGNAGAEDWSLWDGMLALGATVTEVRQGLLFYRRHRENFINCR